MKAFLIDPKEKQVSEVEYSGDWKSIAPLIHAESGLFDLVRLQGRISEGRAIVEGDAVVCAWSTVKDTARVTGHARVYSHAVVDGDTVCDRNTSGRTPRKPWSRKD